jgi:RNA polymerase sigma factor for flagellar operon FliA
MPYTPPSLEAALPVVEEVLAFIRRRQGCGADEAEEFASYARLKLIEDECAVLRRFQGRSELRTFLVVVLQRMFIDFRRERWGTWRPSAEARRLGPAAVALDRLLTRDGYALEEAIELLATSGRAVATRTELRALADRLPRRTRRRMEGEQALAALAIPADTVEESVMAGDRGRRVREIRDALQSIVGRLPDEDATILRLRFEDGLTVGRIGELLGLKEKPLYRRVERLLEILRAELLAGGVTASDVAELIDAGAFGEPRS